MEKEKVIEILEIEVKPYLPKGHWGSVKNIINSLPSDEEIAKRMFNKWLHDEGLGIDELDEMLVIDVKPLYFKWLDKK